jgi:hypothetical protein
MSSSHNSLSRDDATTVLTLANALRRARRENSISVVSGVDELTTCFSSKMFFFESQEEYVDVSGLSTKIQEAETSSDFVQLSSNAEKSFSTSSVPGMLLTALESGKRKTRASSSEKKSTSVTKPAKLVSAVKRKSAKGFPNAPTNAIVSRGDTSPLDEVPEIMLKRKSLKGFTNGENTPACDVDISEKEARMISDSSEHEKNTKNISTSLDQRLNRKRPADHLPSSSKRVRSTPSKA